MKIAIIIYSKSGRTQEAAELIGEGVLTVPECEYKIMQVDAIDLEYLKEAKAVIFGTPTYYSNICWQMKKFFDDGGVNMAGKLGGVFATCNMIGGGSETAMLTLVNHMLVKGMLVYSGGTVLGQPFTHLGVTSVKELPMETQVEKLRVFGKRIAGKAVELLQPLQ